MIDLEHR